MMSIKYYLLVTLVAFSYQLSHCLQSYKMCNPFQNLNIPHCTIVTGDICRECEIGFSVSNDGKSCVNIPNCLSVNEEGECDQCERYYIFDDEGNCVHDYCQLYNEDY